MTDSTSSNTTHRFHLPKKAIKTDCPDCGPRHRKSLSLYVDSTTGESLPDIYGRCDRESNCGYFLSPYDRSMTGVSYADMVRQKERIEPIPKAFFRYARKCKQQGGSRESTIKELQDSPAGATEQQAEIVVRYIFDRSAATQKPTIIFSLPEYLPEQSLGYYERNQFALLLRSQFGPAKAEKLIKRFQIGTSAHWKGACVFWLIDEQNRVRGGQVKLLADDWHTAKYTDYKGQAHSCTSWVHYALQRHLEKAGKDLPDWLTEYSSKAEKSPCLFGLPQLATAPADTPIAIVEAPKTAVVCSAYFPTFIWLAVMGKSYLKPERLAAIRHRRIRLYPDLNAYNDWLKVADELNRQGFRVEMSDYLEQNATNEQRNAGLDLADFLLQQTPTVSTIAEQKASPGSILRLDLSLVTRIPISDCDSYPAEWDEPTPPGAVPTIRQTPVEQYLINHSIQATS